MKVENFWVASGKTLGSIVEFTLRETKGHSLVLFELYWAFTEVQNAVPGYVNIAIFITLGNKICSIFNR